MNDQVLASICEHQQMVRELKALVPEITRLATDMVNTLKHGGKILWMGNGGSAADCRHLAAELVGRFERERPGLAAIALTTDTSIMTSIGNDYGFEHIFNRQIEALCRPEDLVLALSTSGNSENVLTALVTAKQIGAYCAGLTGHEGGMLPDHCDLCLRIPSSRTARIQEGHLLIGHMLCDLVESETMPPDSPHGQSL